MALLPKFTRVDSGGAIHLYAVLISGIDEHELDAALAGEGEPVLEGRPCHQPALLLVTIGTINGAFARLVDEGPLMRPRPPASTADPGLTSVAVLVGHGAADEDSGRAHAPQDGECVISTLE